MTTRLAGARHALPAVQPRQQPRRRPLRRWQPGEPRRLPHRLLLARGARDASASSTSSAPTSSSRPARRRSRTRRGARTEQRETNDLPTLPPARRRPPAGRQAARADGPGRNYLIQHSAGSGKTNSISWLSHRLASLHTAADREGLRLRRRHHRPARPRPPAAGRHLPDRARPGRGEGHRRGLATARTGARRRERGS